MVKRNFKDMIQLIYKKQKLYHIHTNNVIQIVLILTHQYVYLK